MIPCCQKWPPVHTRAAGPGQERPDELAGLTNDERQIYHMLEQGPGSLDDMIERTRWDFGHLHSVLLSLIIKADYPITRCYI